MKNINRKTFRYVDTLDSLHSLHSISQQSISLHKTNNKKFKKARSIAMETSKSIQKYKHQTTILIEWDDILFLQIVLNLVQHIMQKVELIDYFVFVQ